MTTEGQPTLQEPIFEMSASIAKLMPALIKAQSEMGVATKGADNPFYRSKYADLAEVIETCKDALNTNGICFLQPILTGHKGVCVKTMLIHASGEYLSATVDFPVGKVDSQEYGKAISYARRYSLQSLLSIPAEDDDGNTASNKATPQTYTKAMTQDFPPSELLEGKLISLTKGQGSEPGTAGIQMPDGLMKFQVFTVDAGWGGYVGHAIQFRYEKQGRFRVIAEMALADDMKRLSIEAQATAPQAEPEEITIDLGDEAAKYTRGIVKAFKVKTGKKGEFCSVKVENADGEFWANFFGSPAHFGLAEWEEIKGQDIFYIRETDVMDDGKEFHRIVEFFPADVFEQAMMEKSTEEVRV